MLKHPHCDDLHIILSLPAVQIYEFHMLMFKNRTISLGIKCRIIMMEVDCSSLIHIMSQESIIVWVSVILRRTVCDDND